MRLFWLTLWLRWRLWLIWMPWRHWWPWRVMRSWRNRHLKGRISGFTGIATKCDVRPVPPPHGMFRRLPDQSVGFADVRDDRWPDASQK